MSIKLRIEGNYIVAPTIVNIRKIKDEYRNLLNLNLVEITDDMYEVREIELEYRWHKDLMISEISERMVDRMGEPEKVIQLMFEKKFMESPQLCITMEELNNILNKL